jgi:tyrosyl-tRNA synthetase
MNKENGPLIETLKTEVQMVKQEFLNDPERVYKVDELLTRGVEEVYPTYDEFRNELLSGRRLTIYMGIDPTAPELHVGHMSQLRKMERFQNLGHHVVLLIGDFTARIGDPTDKKASRQRLTSEQVLFNANTYIEQASKIIDFSDESINPVEVRYNSEWLSKLNFEDVLELSANFTVQQMLERSMFQKRISEKKPINLIEFLYPLMQGYDSVALKTDVELGGSDQIFNMLLGRELSSRVGINKFVIAGKLLVDPLNKKIGKTEGNMVTLIDDPSTMYQKVMLWGDQITPHALELCSKMSMEQIRIIEEKIKNSELSGLEAKKILAKTMVEELYSKKDAQEAAKIFEALRTQNVEEKDIETFNYDKKIDIKKTFVDILFESGLAKSKSDARRLIEQGGVRIDGVKMISNFEMVNFYGNIVQVGKSSYRKINLLN